VRSRSNSPKYLYADLVKKSASNINAYLIDGRNVLINQRLQPLSNIPPMITGNSAYDGGNLTLSASEREHLLQNYPEASKILRRIYGSNEFLNGIERWCIWIDDSELDAALSIPPIRERVEKTKTFRIAGGDVARGIASRPHKFRYTHVPENSQIIIPRVSSERRTYIPFGFLGPTDVVSDAAQVIYDPQPWIFGIISSRMHMAWVNVVAGRLKTDFRYSSALCYNPFPMPDLDEGRTDRITRLALAIVEERERFPERSVAELYDPDKIPKGLAESHRLLDDAVDRLYRARPFGSDQERVDELFKLYEKMTAAEQKESADA
jgi:hypothetical protein